MAEEAAAVWSVGGRPLLPLLLGLCVAPLLWLCLNLTLGLGGPRSDSALRRLDDSASHEYLDLLDRYEKSLRGASLNCASPSSKWSRPSEGLVLNKSCTELRRRFLIPSRPRSASEEAFPLAFVLIVKSDVGQSVRLLSLLAQPQNSFCIVADAKFRQQTERSLEFLRSCLPNVIAPKEPFLRIDWGTFSVLQAAYSCLAALDSSGRPWRYAQILGWPDAPLKTNGEMVELFRLLDGAQDSELKPTQPARYKHRVQTYTKLPKNGLNERGYRFGVFYKDSGGTIFAREEPKAPPPHNVTMYKGSFAASLSRDFVRWMLSDQKAKDIYAWLNETYIPDELYWATLIHNPHLGAPGSFPGHCLPEWRKAGLGKGWVSREQGWGKAKCPDGKLSHASCVFGVGSLTFLRRSPRLVAHKFYPDFQPAAWECLALEFRRRTALPESAAFPAAFYAQLSAVRHRRNASLPCARLPMTRFF